MIDSLVKPLMTLIKLLLFSYALLHFNILVLRAQNNEQERGVRRIETNFRENQGRFIVAVIGIDNYDHWPRLKNAQNDALGLQDILVKNFGFIKLVEPLLDGMADKSTIMRFVEDDLYSKLKVDDNLVLFFAGHGHTRIDTIGNEILETGYIVPVNAAFGIAQHWSEYIEIDQFLKSVSRLPARHIMVILDACHSGFALGNSVKQFRSLPRYARELNAKLSRRVITSAMRDQIALDGGPIPYHSLFTGTLIDGLTWGKTDIDGNGLVTSSEIGLYLQKRVGSESISEQTPDFGSFYLDDRGEMIISLENESFDALKARASSLLRRGEFISFIKIVKQLSEIRPIDPAVLYFKYRISLYERRINDAIAFILELKNLNLEEGMIPLSKKDLWELEHQLYYWKTILELPAQELDVDFKVVVNNTLTADVMEFDNVTKTGFKIEPGTTFTIEIQNQRGTNIYVYLIMIDNDGRIIPAPLDYGSFNVISGMKRLTFPFVQDGTIALEEFRFFVSHQRIASLERSPIPGSRAGLPPVELDPYYNKVELEIIYILSVSDYTILNDP